MNPSFQTRLGEILFELTVYDRMGTRSLEGIREEAQQQITELFKEIIGEEDTNYPSLNLDKTPHEDAVIRNQLKSELRKAIEG